MDLSGIISISGMSGLYKVVAQSKNGIIVESLVDKKRVPAYSTYKISGLEDISVFTTGDDMPLADVIQKIYDKEKGGPAMDGKTSNEADAKKYFGEVLPDYDKDRVYISDIKKILTWYNILQKSGALEKKEEKKDTKAETSEEGKKTTREAKAKAAATAPKAKPKDTAKGAASSVAKGKKTSTIRKTGA
jgi:hypothetical protein